MKKEIKHNATHSRHSLLDDFLLSAASSNESNYTEVLENQLKLILIHAEDAFVFVDLDYRIRAFNLHFKQMYAQIMGIDVILGDSILNYTLPERKEILKKVYDGVFEGKRMETEITLENKKGEKFIYFNIFKPALDHANNIIGAYVSSIDITETVNAIQHIAQNEKRFRTLIEQSGDAIAIVDQDGIIKFISESTKHVLGYQKDELLEHKIFEIIHPDDIPAAQRLRDLAFKKPGVPIRSKAARALHQDGSWRWYEATLTNLLGDQLINGLVYNFRDVTERIKLRQEIEFDQRNLAAIINNTKDLIWSVDRNYRLITANNNFLEVMHAMTGIWLKRNDDLLLNQNFSEEFITLWKSFYDRGFKGETVKEEIYTAERESTNGAWSEIVINPIVVDNEIVGLTCYGSEITASRTVREAIVALSQTFAHLQSDEFYDAVCRHISEVTKADYVFIGIKNEKKQVEIIGGRACREPLNVKYYDFLNTPCDIVLNGNNYCCEVSLREKFPEDTLLETMNVNAYMGVSLKNQFGESIGLIAIMHHENFKDRELAEKMLHVFADRTAAEIQRSQQEKALEELNSKLIQSKLQLEKVSENVPVILYQFEMKQNGQMTFPFMSSNVNKFMADVDPMQLKKDASHLFNKMHVDDISKFSQSIIESWKNLTKWEKEFRILKSSNEYEWFKGVSAPERQANGDVVWFGYIEWIHEKKLIEKEQELIHEITIKVNSKENLRKSLSDSLSKICAFTDFSAAEIWFVKSDKETLYLNSWHSINAKYEQLMLDAGHTFTIGEGLPGITLKDRKNFHYKNLHINPEFVRQKEASLLGFHDALSVPIISDDQAIAVAIFFSEKSVRNAEYVFRLLNRIALQLAIFIERKKLINEQERFFEYSPELICIVDKKGYFRRVNPAFTRLLEYSEKELLTNPFTHFLHPADKENSENVLAGNWKGLKTNALINRYITRSGKIKYILWHSSEVLDENDEVFGFGSDITALQNTNLELQKFKNVIENTRDAIFMMNYETNQLIFNKSLASIIGDEKHFNVQNFFDVYTDSAIQENIKKSLSDGKEWNGTVAIYDHSDKVHYFQLNAGVILNDRKEIVAAFGIHTEITERIALEEALLQNNKRITNILESINDGFIALNKEWEVTYWNKKAEEILGRKTEEMMGKVVWDYFPEALDLEFFKAYKRVMETKVKENFLEYFAPLKAWFDVSAYPNEEGVSVFFKDVTELKRSSAERKKYLGTLDRSLNEIYIFDSNTLKFEYVNEGALKNIGYTMLELNKMTPLDIKPEYNEKKFFKLIEPLKNRTKEKIVFETIHLRKDGSTYPVEVHLQLIEDHERAIFLAIILDITERKKAEEKLIKLNSALEIRNQELISINAELEQFAYVASHDMQEPLRMITSFMNQLEKKYNDQLDETGRLYIHFAVDGATRMRKIILDLLEYSRMSKKDKELSTFSSGALLMEAVKLNKGIIDEKKAIISWENLPEVRASRPGLLIVFQNLLQNALKYQPENNQPVITVSCVDDNTHWKFSFTDNGIGIDSKFFEKIFVIFHRLHNREKYSGSGIGLAICKKIIENHGGKIWVESIKEKGSKFLFTIEK